MGINDKEDNKIVNKYINKYKLNFPVPLDVHGKVGKEYGVRVHPEHFLVNRRGELIGKSLGPRNWTDAKNRDLIRFLLDQD